MALKRADGHVVRPLVLAGRRGRRTDAADLADARAQPPTPSSSSSPRSSGSSTGRSSFPTPSRRRAPGSTPCSAIRRGRRSSRRAWSSSRGTTRCTGRTGRPRRSRSSRAVRRRPRLEDELDRLSGRVQGDGERRKDAATRSTCRSAAARQASDWPAAGRSLAASARISPHREHPYRHPGFRQDLHLQALPRGGAPPPSRRRAARDACPVGDLHRQGLDRAPQGRSWSAARGSGATASRTGPSSSRSTRSFKFVPIVVERGGSTEAINAAFMRHDVARVGAARRARRSLAVADIERFAPTHLVVHGVRRTTATSSSSSGSTRDHPLLGDVVAQRWRYVLAGVQHDQRRKHFVARAKLEKAGLLGAEDDTRDPRVRARLRRAGYLPLYEGKSLLAPRPVLRRARRETSASSWRSTTARGQPGTEAWEVPRLCMRNVAQLNQPADVHRRLMPPAVHGNSAPTLNGLAWSECSRSTAS